MGRRTYYKQAFQCRSWPTNVGDISKGIAAVLCIFFFFFRMRRTLDGVYRLSSSIISA